MWSAGGEGKGVKKMSKRSALKNVGKDQRAKMAKKFQCSPKFSQSQMTYCLARAWTLLLLKC